MRKINEVLAIIEGNVPNPERSCTVTRKVMDTLFCYTEVMKEFQKKKKSQTTIGCSFQKTKVSKEVTAEEVEMDTTEEDDE